MNKRFESPRLWAAMAHLTPSLWDLLFRSHVGVRGMADRSNFHITRWLRQRWGHMANIVASDFFRSNDIINVAIRTNLALSMCRPSGPSRHPYTLRWTTELTLRNGSPSTTTTTIPPFVRRMYTSGTLWTTTGVRQIHYPFTPVDANISMVFTAIPNRVPSLAPGVTYQESTDTWRQIFHYPADGSPKPPEETASRPYSHPRGYVTSSPVASEPSPRANDEIILGEWDNVDAHDFLDDVFVARVKNNVSANATNAPRLLGKINHDLNFSSQEDLTHSTFWRSKSDVTEPPLTHNLGNTDANYDTFNDTNSMTHTRNTTQDRDKGAILTHEPLYPTITSSLEDELLPSNIQHNTDSSLLVRNDTLDGYSMSSISKNTHINPQSTMASSTQDSYSSKTHENSFLDLESNATEDGSHLLAIDDVTSTGHSSIVPEDVLMTSQSVSIPLGQEGGGVTQEGRHSDGSVSDTESINDLNTSGILVLPHHLILEDSTKQSQALQHTTRQVGSLTGVPKVIAQTPIVTTMTVQPDLTMQPSALTFIIQSDSSVARIQPSTSTVRYQTYDATLTPQRGMSDLEVTKSSSNVT
ncbi:hypothetical protein GWK47_054020 [Chionoecetes opilio]|uniref:Uncharacterized protein n=1 Tax=Chionoecetes opilio TaxID=41210 RepID=A0A8J4Y063_CHIOP|nr:hypothetical protein GWK47_054020 [Chionoecetes opilio]